MNAISGGKHNNHQNQSGLGGLASSLLGGGSSHGGSGHGGNGGLAGQLVSSFLGGNKPHNSQQQQQSGQHSGGYGGSTGSAHQQGGLMGMASGFLGGQGSSSVSRVASTCGHPADL